MRQSINNTVHDIEIELEPLLLIVDDDSVIRRLLLDFLSAQGFRCEAAANAAEARTYIAMKKFDLIILDIMMPGETGIELAGNIRLTDQTPILLLTARDQLADKLEAFEVGADDYLTKPFEPLELVARIKSQLRRQKPIISENNILLFSNFSFDLKNGFLTHDSVTIALTSTERLLLKLLAQRPNQPFSREDLAQKIGHRVSERTVDVQVNRLRHKLKCIDPSLDLVQTIRHQGYALIINI
ncbi:MAG: response regulator transcription factor [Candidatus Paracaedibacteraceae bacterium]|nr:response regulator transcription factor [Candidatus Paracaedibacteraceae bacterium]